MEQHTYIEHLQALQADSDFKDRLKPSALARYVQQVATNHAVNLGFLAEYYKENHFVFLLAKQAIEYKRMPISCEKLRFETTPEQCKRASVKRLTVVYDENNEEVACIDSRWVLVDTETNRIMRRPPEEFMKTWAEDLPRSLEMRLKKTDNLQQVNALYANYGICDRNNHINNAYYFDALCNAVPDEIMREKEVKFCCVHYHREITFGQTADIKIGKTENGYYIFAENNGKCAFDGNIIFK